MTQQTSKTWQTYSFLFKNIEMRKLCWFYFHQWQFRHIVQTADYLYNRPLFILLLWFLTTFSFGYSSCYLIRAQYYRNKYENVLKNLLNMRPFCLSLFINRYQDRWYRQMQKADDYDYLKNSLRYPSRNFFKLFS